MPDQNINTADTAEVVPAGPAKIDAVAEIIEKINESKYILVAMSGGPSIDELAAAIGLTSYLNKVGKRATAIYSGGMPAALGFLDTGDTFDNSADVLQDFVISIDKSKADHLRYKPEGDDVRIFITPYNNKITSDDLDFSYGDFNVDLVIALNVASGIDLDEALREYGTIMQDAAIVNITASKPGKLGDIEWSNSGASSVSEMVAHLLHEMHNDVSIDSDEATAFFAGIVSATNRFSNASTTPFTLTVSSWLMECGANQQLVAENITSDVDNQLFTISNNPEPKADENMEISHDEDAQGDGEVEVDASEESETGEALADLKEIQDELNAEEDLTVNQPVATPVEVAPVEVAPEAVTSVEAAPVEVTPVAEATPVVGATPAAPIAEATPIAEPAPVTEPAPAAESVSDTASSAEPVSSDDGYIASNKETVIAVPEGFNPEAVSVDDNSRFGKMLEDALAGDSNPAVMNAPTVTPQQEINGVPEINFAPAADVEILPPPPAPTMMPGMPQMPPTQVTPQQMPVAASAQPVQPANQAVPQMAQAPATQEALIQSRQPVQLVPQQPTAENNPGIADPGAFRIPGM